VSRAGLLSGELGGIAPADPALEIGSRSLVDLPYGRRSVQARICCLAVSA